MKHFIQSIRSLAIALILVGGVSLASAQNTWTPPSVAAPNGNVDAPINVSPITQFKKGGIIIEGLNAAGDILAYPFSVLNGNVGIGTSTPRAKLGVVGKIQIKDGTEGVGKVLVSDADGLASWQTGSGSASGGVSKIIAGPGITLSPTGGTGEVTISTGGQTIDGFPESIMCGPISPGLYGQSGYIRVKMPYLYQGSALLGSSLDNAVSYGVSPVFLPDTQQTLRVYSIVVVYQKSTRTFFGAYKSIYDNGGGAAAMSVNQTDRQGCPASI